MSDIFTPDKTKEAVGFSLFLRFTPHFEIAYQDPWFVVVHKPSAMATHPGPGVLTPSALETLRDHLRSWVYPVHRLDQGTSGLLIFGLSSEAARAGQQMIMAADFRKIYVALIRGVLSPQEGSIDYPIDQKPALTHWQTLRTFECPWPSARHPTSRYSLVGLAPQTGRTHQLRRHLHHLSHPIIGDSRYGDGRHNRKMEELLGQKRLCLHCLQLSGTHPFTQKPVVWRDERGIAELRGLGIIYPD